MEWLGIRGLVGPYSKQQKRAQQEKEAQQQTHFRLLPTAMVTQRRLLLLVLYLIHVQAYQPQSGFFGGQQGCYGGQARPLRASSIVDAVTTRLQGFGRKKSVQTRSEDDQMADYLEGKPWRAPKIKNLKYIYRPWKDSYLERFRDEEDDTVCLYSLPPDGLLGGWDRTRVEDLWSWPWLWSKAKVTSTLSSIARHSALFTHLPTHPACVHDAGGAAELDPQGLFRGRRGGDCAGTHGDGQLVRRIRPGEPPPRPSPHPLPHPLPHPRPSPHPLTHPRPG